MNGGGFILAQINVIKIRNVYKQGSPYSDDSCVFLRNGQ